MPDTREAAYRDSCIFLSYINERPGRMPVLDALPEDNAGGSLKLRTSEISRLEVAFAASGQKQRELDEAVERKIANLRPGGVEIVERHDGIGRKAGSLMRQGIVIRLEPQTPRCDSPGYRAMALDGWVSRGRVPYLWQKPRQVWRHRWIQYPGTVHPAAQDALARFVRRVALRAPPSGPLLVRSKSLCYNLPCAGRGPVEETPLHGARPFASGAESYASGRE